MFVLGIDTCGPSGTVALSRLNESQTVQLIAQKELMGRTYSATLVSAIEELLSGNGLRLGDVGCIVIVSGPGSFTGVRVGLAAAKGLAEGAGLPVVAISRLEVLAKKAEVASAALDAHRHEIFLRVSDGSGQVRELLADASELARISACSTIAVCDDAAAGLLQRLRPDGHLVRVAAPTAADALTVAAAEVHARNFGDVGVLDGQYLRRSDAEIFGNTVLKP